MNIKDLLSQKSTTIVDVREPWEFAEGHVKGSKNIPLGDVYSRVDEFRGMSKPLLLVCRSGVRSGNATGYLRAQGIEEVYNGGGWKDLEEL